MAFRSTVKPNLSFRVLAGNCLAMAQGIVGAPVRNRSATYASRETKYRHRNRSIPNAVCVLWFDHWGAYDDGNGPYDGVPVGQPANWGHVVVNVPGRGLASSSPVPGEESTPYYYDSIEDVERAFNCSFTFWTEDLNGKRVCQEEDVMTPAQEKKLDRMLAALEANPEKVAKAVMQYKVVRHPVADKLGTTTLATFLAKGETLARRNISRFDQLIKLWKKQGPAA